MDAVEEIKSRLSIEDVVSQYLELKHSGRNFKGLSPFSNEKTASLMVSPEKQIWHDFSSGKGGDMFSFVMEAEGLDFKAALELLARQAGVDLDQFRTKQGTTSSSQKERLYSVLELATKFYQVHLSKHKPTLEYVFKTRQFSKQTVLTFQLGYAPNQETALLTFLQKKGFTANEIKQAGLSTQRYRGPSDMFRDRLMIPLMDSTGRIIGFTARILHDDPNAPKYINTPQTALYDKSRHVFGLHLAKESIRKTDYVVVAEGNLDVIGSHQAGVTNVVATAGTAMTEAHLKALQRFTTDVRLAFDQDEAGLRATERAIPIASRVGVSLSIITLPEGKDPDELAKKDPEAWRRVVTTPTYAVDWIMERYAQQLDLSSAQGKRQFSDQVLLTIQGLGDSVERDHYIVQVAELLGISADALRSKLVQLGQKTTPARRRPTVPAKLNPARVEIIKAQNRILSLAFALPSLRTYIEPLTTAMLPDPAAQEVLVFLQAHPDFNEESSPTALREFSDYVKMLRLQYEELYQGLEALELRYEAARLQIRLIENHVKTLKTTLATAMQTADEQQTQQLLQQAKELDQLLNITKETTK